MNVNIFNIYFNQLTELIKDIKQLKKEISEMENNISEKEKRNSDSYNSVMSDLILKERKIKSLMENKHFTYIKYIDFIDDRDIVGITGMELKDSIGFIFSEIVNRISIEEISRIQSRDKKTISFVFREDIYSNEVEFSFKTLNGLPNVPSNVKIEYGDYTDDFFEPNFRYYNRNRADIFINTFYFYPKKVKRMVFEFEDEPEFSSCFCNLYSCEFNTSLNSELILNVKNEKNLNIMNLYKTTDETSVPLDFFYSLDNITFNKLDFDSKRETVININNSTEFQIKIKPDYNNVYQKEEKETTVDIIPRTSMVRTKGVAKFETIGDTSDINIIFSYSSYNAIKILIDDLFSSSNEANKKTIDDFIVIENGIYKLRKDFVIVTDKIGEKEKTMMYFDDFSVIKDDQFYFKFFLNKKDNELYYSEFMEQFNFYVEIYTEKNKEKINENLLTPYIFDLSLKG